MRALIVYESVHGNTRDIARAIAAGLSPTLPTDVVDVGEAPAVPGTDVDLLIVGAPTHLFGLSRGRIGVASGPTHPPVARTASLRAWLDALPRTPQRRDALTFDTRLRVHALRTSAATGAAKRLRKRGYRILWPSQSYHIAKPSGPLADRQIERAQLWGRWIGEGIEVKQSRL
jgi:Flavodoxin domain